MLLANILFIFVCLLTFALLVTAVAHIWVAVPFIPTPMKVAREMVKLADLQGDEMVYDLGAGDARLPILAKKMHPGITSVGVEFVPTVWLLGKIRIWLSRQDVSLKMGNVLSVDLQDADCIFLYLIPSIMNPLKQKFDRELRPGTKIVSYCFSLPEKEPIKEVEVPWLSGRRKLRLYEW